MARKSYARPTIKKRKVYNKPTIKKPYKSPTAKKPYRQPGENLADSFEIFRQGIKIASREVMVAFAERLVQEAKAVLNDQSYNWKPLKAYYKKWKIEHGLDERILIATGFYRDSITWWEDMEGNIHIGIPPGLVLENGLPLATLAAIHEYGTDTIPARPLWRPLLSSFLRRNKDFAFIYNQAVRAAMGR